MEFLIRKLYKCVDIMKSDQETINLSNALGKIRGRFKSGSNKNPVTSNKR